MLQRIKGLVSQKLPWFRTYVRERHLRRNATVLIHIGKCGGGTLRKGIENAAVNPVDATVHITKPLYRKDLRYIVVARSPIARLQSAFRWRYRLVVTEEKQKNMFPGEYEILTKYGSLNRIAEALYDDHGCPNFLVHREIKVIHHIREDIAFYLKELLERCTPNQIIAVLMQESLDDDIQRVFGYINKLREHDNRGGSLICELSSKAVTNLRLFFEEDYLALSKLFCWGKISEESFLMAMRTEVSTVRTPTTADAVPHPRLDGE